MKHVAVVVGLLTLGIVGCGSATDGGGSTVLDGGAGAGGAAGAGFVLAGAGGSAPSGAGGDGSGGSQSLAGAGAGGAAGSAPAGVPGYPAGTVDLCFGHGCPMGECDDGMFFSNTLCASVYTAPVGPNSSYCNTGETDSYCMQVGMKYDPDFAVSCVNGAATVMKCQYGCGSNQGEVMYACSSL